MGWITDKDGHWKSWADQTPEERMAFNKWVDEASGTDISYLDKIYPSTNAYNIVYVTPTGHEGDRIHHKRDRISFSIDKEARE